MDEAREGGEPHGEGDVEGLISAFRRWSEDDRLQQAAAQRSRQRWLRQQALEETTLGGVLVNLAERRTSVGLRTTSHLLRGRLVGAGAEVAVIEDRQRRATILNLAALVSVELPAGPGGNEMPVAGRRLPALTLGFSDALAALSAEVLPVCLYLPGEALVGELVGAGEDIVVLRAPAASPRHTYVQPDRIEACSLR